MCLDSCQDRCGQSDWDDRYPADDPCYCDVECKTNRDCCRDVEAECPAIAGEGNN